MRVKIKLKEDVPTRVKVNGMYLGRHLITSEEQEFEFEEHEADLLKSEQFNFYMEKIGRVVYREDTVSPTLKKKTRLKKRVEHAETIEA